MDGRLGIGHFGGGFYHVIPLQRRQTTNLALALLLAQKFGLLPYLGNRVRRQVVLLYEEVEEAAKHAE